MKLLESHFQIAAIGNFQGIFKGFGDMLKDSVHFLKITKNKIRWFQTAAFVRLPGAFLYLTIIGHRAPERRPYSYNGYHS